MLVATVHFMVLVQSDSLQYKNKHGEFDCELRMIVHQSQAGCIIGRAGFKVKELREVCICHLFPKCLTLLHAF
jgi:predicted RNA-binding protein YlqC (UPF0109 family)